jgi:hypothetical protein
VYEYVGLFAGLVDEVGGGVEVQTEIVVLVVLARDVERVGDVLFGVADVDVFAGGEERGDVVLWVVGEVLLRVCRFYAASRLPMKMPPLLLEGYSTHSMSSGKTWWAGRLR